jgi:transposase
MGKYSDQTKVAAAADYCTGHLGLQQVARRHGVNVASLRPWVAAYRVHGKAGVQTKQRTVYSAAFKMSVLRRMSSEQLSCRQAAALFNIRNRGMILIWERAYEMGGVAALHPHALTRRRTMTEQTDIKSRGSRPEDETRTRQELLDELHRLRMENVYLKKLKALAQANRQPPREKEPGSCKS